MRTKFALLATTVGAAALTALLAASPAVAKGGRPLGRPVKTSGACTDRTSSFTLKSMFDDEPFAQTVGAELEVDTGVVRQTWHVTLTDNDVVFYDQLVETSGPEGAFNVTQPDEGAFDIAHTIVARAVNQDNGAVCTGQVIDQPIR